MDPSSNGRPDNNGVTSSSNQSIPAVEDGGGSIFLPHNYQLGNYRIIKVLGRGGFGITYLAHDLKLNREVVIKENLPSALSNRASTTYRVQPLTEGNAAGSYEWALRNFLNEARTLSSLEHPNIIRIFTAFEELGTAYYVMPHISGTSLDKVRYPMPEAKIRPILLAMLDALRYLHSRTPVLLHRDIKPANILLRPDGTPVLIDFGTARVLSEHSQTVVESPGYTPFEQMRTRGNVGPWTDLYALGGTMYKLITGEPPVRCLDRIGEDPQPRLADNTELLKNYSPRLLESIDKALALEVRNRWQSAEEWMKALAETGKKPDPLPNGNSKPSGDTKQGKEPKKSTPKRSSRKGKNVLVATLFFGLVACFVCCSYLLNGSIQNQLGNMYRDGRYFSQDAAKAVSWYKRAAECGHADAQNKLGGMYREGRGVAQDDAQAVAWFRKAAKQGFALAQYNLGGMYREGRGVAQDDAQAVAWFRKAAKQGNAAAQNDLGWMYKEGRGVAQDDTQAVAWYRKAAEQGNAAAQNNLGWMYKEGRGVAQDNAQAVAWYRKVAEQGYAVAQNNLGVMYAEGRGVTQDDSQAVDWYRKAAEQGLASAQNNLGDMFYAGRGVPKDDAQAVAWYRKAAEQGNAAAQNDLGGMYKEGWGVAQDDAQAVAWYRKAAEQGFAAAQYNLGWMYKEGRGVAQDDEQAVAWFRNAAMQGFALAQYNLGEMYYAGRGVAQDDAQAVVWYRKAAEQGEAAAQFVLGWMYQEGCGVPKNKSEAIKWFRKAAKQGNEYAKDTLRRLGVEP